MNLKDTANNTEKSGKTVESKDINLILTLTKEGIVKVQGPIVNKPLCNYMVDVAKQVILSYKPKSAIETPKPVIT